MILAGGDDTATDLVLGDNGMATFTAAGVLLDLHTDTPAIGGNDIITTGDGADLVMGGSGDDVVLASANDAAAAAFLDLLAVPNYVVSQALVNALLLVPAGDGATDVVFGDNGVALYVSGRLTHLDSIDGTFGGRDAIATGNGADIVIAGRDNDLVLAGGTGRGRIASSATTAA